MLTLLGCAYQTLIVVKLGANSKNLFIKQSILYTTIDICIVIVKKHHILFLFYKTSEMAMIQISILLLKFNK